MRSFQILCFFGVLIFNNAIFIINRKGVCPPPRVDPALISCLRVTDVSPACRHDSDCPGSTMKCCLEGCSVECKEPISQSRSGICPPRLPPNTAEKCPIGAGAAISNCKGTGQDSDCPGKTQKCCPSMCFSLQCKEPISHWKEECGPPPYPNIRCFAYIQKCHADADCGKDEGKICCGVPCGTACKDRVRT